MQKTLNYNDIVFKVSKQALIHEIQACSLWGVYERPSSTKWRAWEKWEKFFGGDCGISGANTFNFSIVGYFTQDGKKYKAFVTSNNNYCYEVK